jgi:RNA polymerase sigma-70 factor (ECF subfamily)
MDIAVRNLLDSDRRQRSPHSLRSRRADEPSDEQLMTNLDGPGVEAALSKLYDRYNRTVFGVGLKILGDRSMAEELVQEVFLKVWRSSGTFDPSRGGFSTWLYRVTRSCALDVYHKRARRVRQAPDGDPYIAATKDASDGPQELVDGSWLSWRVSRALEVLDAPHREVIELAYFAGLSQREISVRTGMPLGTVKTRTASAFKSLRGELTIQDTSREACDEVRADPPEPDSIPPGRAGARGSCRRAAPPGVLPRLPRRGPGAKEGEPCPRGGAPTRGSPFLPEGRDPISGAHGSGATFSRR